MITFQGISVWDTGEVIDLVVSDADAAFFADEGCLGVESDAVIDAAGMVLAPSFADPHVHFRDPGQTYKESMISGCRAAAAGGYGHVLIMPNTLPALDGQTITDSAAAGASEVLEAGYENVIDFLQHYEEAHNVTLPVHYDLCVCASKDRAGKVASDPQDWQRYVITDDESDDTDKTAAMFLHPVTAISDDGSAVPEGILNEVLAHAQQTGLYLIEHCEHHDTGAVNEGPVSKQLGVPGIPEDTELNIVARDIEAARRTGVHVHFQHVSTAISFDAIRQAKAEGLPITCETAPHYLALSDEALLKYGTLAKMNPPLRSEQDRLATITAIADGTVDMLATDHAPHTLEEKALGFLEAPNGIIGLECAYGVAHKVLVDAGHISDQRLIELMSVNPLELMGYEDPNIAQQLDDFAEAATQERPRRVLDLGSFEDACDLNLVVLNPGEQWTVNPDEFHSAARNTPFGGWDVTGRVIATIRCGALAFSRIQQ